MQAIAIEALSIIQHGNIDNARYAYVNCEDYDTYRNLPAAIKLVDKNGRLSSHVYVLTGWNSDSARACYTTNHVYAIRENK